MSENSGFDLRKFLVKAAAAGYVVILIVLIVFTVLGAIASFVAVVDSKGPNLMNSVTFFGAFFAMTVIWFLGGLALSRSNFAWMN